MPRSIRTLAIAILLVVAAGALWAPGAGAQSPAQGPGGPVLIVTGPGATKAFGSYYAEILRAEGLNEFAVTDKGDLNATTLANYQVVLLSSTSLTGAQARAPDRLGAGRRQPDRHAARRPSPACSASAPTPAISAMRYLKVNTSLAPGAGITGDTMQFHGTADVTSASAPRRWRRCTRTPTAHVGSRRDPPRVGSAGGQAAAFTYDLARSVVYTRQGNPAWAGTSATARSTRSAPTTSSSAPRWATCGLTGSTSARSRSRRPTSSSACWRTSSRR